MQARGSATWQAQLQHSGIILKFKAPFEAVIWNRLGMLRPFGELKNQRWHRRTLSCELYTSLKTKYEGPSQYSLYCYLTESTCIASRAHPCLRRSLLYAFKLKCCTFFPILYQCTLRQVRSVNSRCMICDSPLSIPGFKPSVCDAPLCSFRHEEFGT